eukprot:6197739-Pleurochrysis_carterae.AAC.6
MTASPRCTAETINFSTVAYTTRTHTSYHVVNAQRNRLNDGRDTEVVASHRLAAVSPATSCPITWRSFAD